MTENDWREGANTDAMIRWVGAHASPRKRTLVNCAQCRRLESLMHPDLLGAVEALERFADGRVTWAELNSWLRQVETCAGRARDRWHRADRDVDTAAHRRDTPRNSDGPSAPTTALFVGADYLRARAARLEAAAASAAVQVVWFSVVAIPAVLTDVSMSYSEITQRQAEASAIKELAHDWDGRAADLAEQFDRHSRQRAQIAAEAQEWADRGMTMLDGVSERRIAEARGRADRELVRTLHDLFGNPFRPVTFEARWRTSDVVALACTIYEDGAFDRMPILADALMDAGCNDDEVIGHCREPGAHYRGCWVVDGVLDFDTMPAAL